MTPRNGEKRPPVYLVNKQPAEQKATNEKALAVLQEYRPAHQEPLPSREELQSLNAELIALNSQLHADLERHRATANELQNVLYSTDIATLFLDAGLKVRFFTPACKALFPIIPSDLSRPLSDPSSMLLHNDILTDARAVLRTAVSRQRDIEVYSGAWYIRRVSPYRTQDNSVEGIVITFADITERRRMADALEAARRKAELATAAKSRCLAAASHDLRQPLQTLALVQGHLAKLVQGDQACKLVARLDQTRDTMSSMLNTLLPIGTDELLASIDRVIEQPQNASKLSGWCKIAAEHVAGLTPRQRQIMQRVLAGHPSKNIAMDLCISPHTVENHRASIMKKTGTKSLPELARLALAAGWSDARESAA